MCRDVLKHESSGAFMFTFEESYFGEVWELKLRYFQDVEENLETRKTALNQLYALQPARTQHQVFFRIVYNKALKLLATHITSLNVEEPINVK